MCGVFLQSCTLEDKLVNVLKESVRFCDDEIEEMKKNAYDIKDGCTSDIENLRKQFLYLEHYSRRENLKFLGIPERIISADEDDDRPSEDTKALVYKFMEDELAIENPQQKIEFQRIHRLGKSAKNGPRPILARFLRYSDREEVLQLARSKLKDSDFAGLPRCKNLTRFSLFVGFCFAVRYCFKCFCFLCFTSSVSFTGSYTEVKPILQSTKTFPKNCMTFEKLKGTKLKQRRKRV